MPERDWFNLTRLGWGLALPVLFLCALGLATIHATERGASRAATAGAFAEREAAEVGRLRSAVDAIGVTTLKQAGFILLGVCLMLAVLGPSYQRIGRYAYPIYWLVIGLLGLLVIDRYIDLPLIPVKRFTRRWIQLGPLSVQPSEFMKIAFIIGLARYLRFRKNYRNWTGLVAPFALTLLPMFLILRQPDLGTVLMLLPVLFAMLFVAGARLRHLLIIITLGAASMPLFYFFGMKDYQKQRVQLVFEQNSADPNWQRGIGYQLRQSKIALGTGGVTGQGYGQGMFIQHELLPEKENDFIFAIVGHQWGLLGGLLVIAAYGMIVLCGIEVATVTNDPFGRLLAIGVIVMIVAQALLNIGMTMGLAPITGMTLPFVSAGGSSLWANFIALGLLVNVAQRRPMLIADPPFEHED